MPLPEVFKVSLSSSAWPFSSQLAGGGLALPLCSSPARFWARSMCHWLLTSLTCSERISHFNSHNKPITNHRSSLSNPNRPTTSRHNRSSSPCHPTRKGISLHPHSQAPIKRVDSSINIPQHRSPTTKRLRRNILPRRCHHSSNKGMSIASSQQYASFRTHSHARASETWLMGSWKD